MDDKDLLDLLRHESIIPTVLVADSGKIDYANQIFCEIFDIVDPVGEAFSNLDNTIFLAGVSKKIISRIMTIKNKRYLLRSKRLHHRNYLGTMLRFIPMENSGVEEVFWKYSELKKKMEVYEQYSNSAAKYSLDDIIGESTEIHYLKTIIKDKSFFDTSVLITGETGTGKEVVAHALHECSTRSQGPFIVINCGAVPEEIWEAELFGYEEGSFTGAVKGGKIGKFEAAHGGTVFLDEIGDLPLRTQSKILRVLQEQEIQPVGGHGIKKVDVRVIAATNQNLEEMVENKQFRGDLYYRINVMRLHIPPLRERLEDIPLLVQSFLDKLNKKYSLNKKISSDLIKYMMCQDWPGNIRQLQNRIEHAYVMSETEISLQDLDLPKKITHYYSLSLEKSLTEQLLDLERQLILKALEVADGNKNQAAELLGVNRSSLYQRMSKLNIEL